jgi:hypothetical protein
VLDPDGFGNDRTDATRHCEPGQRDEQMNQEEDDFAHLRIVAKCRQNDEFWINLAIRHLHAHLAAPFAATGSAFAFAAFAYQRPDSFTVRF